MKIFNFYKISFIIIFPERQEKWEQRVKQVATGLYEGLEIADALDIMEALDRGTDIDEVKQYLILKNALEKLFTQLETLY